MGSAVGPSKGGLTQASFRKESTRYPFQRRLLLQALLDGELSECEARRAAQLLTADAEALLLLRELSLVKCILAGNEADRRMPQPWGCYWNRIRRSLAESAGNESGHTCSAAHGASGRGTLNSGVAPAVQLVTGIVQEDDAETQTAIPIPALSADVETNQEPT